MIKFCPYELVPASFNVWRPVYLEVAKAVIARLSDPRFEFIHFGSSSFEVGGKGIIDISILYQAGCLEQAVSHLESFGFTAQHSDTPFPDTRPRKDIGVIFDDEKFNIHAHVIELNSEEHLKQLAYKQHMLANPDDRAAYEQQKQAVLATGKRHQDEYGKAKSPFVKALLSRL
ncbi:GrpB family protein [Pseudoalteromonas luteoviolacea]|uniref:GrpB family protein n=1 Tax=Pseudoalteromonas luteoviolacea TaxID=43657 RepID=UPI0011547EEE|nr:GrpB family protein [Pseudoalteromonas luteoviolacea]TQF66775.1 GrpB family protein [Pseudoalteromonas luteoviolacea]